MNQDPAGLPARLVYQEPPFPEATTGEIAKQVFARPLSGNRTAVLFLNRASTALTMNVTWQQLGMVEDVRGYELFDVLRQEKINETHSGGYFAAKVPSHDVVFVVVSHNAHRQ